MSYQFRAATHDDMPMLRVWLRTPHAIRWWGDPAEQEALLREDLDNPLMTMRIVSHDGRAFAYAQDYAIDSWPQPHFAGLPQSARAIDTFIGVPDMIGRGHGSYYLRLRAEQLIAEGAPLIAIDPAVANLRAQRAYEKAGFRRGEVVETAEGPAVLMIFGGSESPPPLAGEG